MKNITTILIISFLVSSFTFENGQSEQIDNGNSYHVMALSGLKMRDLPSLKGKKILTIPYNGEVELIDTGESYDELKIKEFEEFYTTGNWVKVRYNDKEGFVFSGYLTQIKLPSLEQNHGVADYDKKLEHYFNNTFYATGDKYNVVKYSGEWCNESEQDCTCAYSMNFASRIVYYSYSNCDEEGKKIRAEIENISLQEAYYIMKVLDINQTKFNKKKEDVKFNKKFSTIEVFPDDAGCYYYIDQRRRNTVEINITCSH